jgi:N-acetylmuramoyl-L-alanine amidase
MTKWNRTQTGVFLLSLVSTFVCQAALGSPDICIDPGHGGSASGTPYTGVSGYYEKDVNLAVADTLARIIQMSAYYSYIMTRATDTNPALARRAFIADSSNATVFLSIHHNGDSVSRTAQYTLTTYCNYHTIDNDPFARLRDSSGLFAKKLGLKIRDGFGYTLNPPESHTYEVLRLSPNTSSLAEASFLSDTVRNEGRKFYFNTDQHINVEAQALYDGIHSYCTGQGIGLIDYEYANKEPTDPTFYPLNVTIQVGMGQTTRVWPLPYEGCWGLNERIELAAMGFSKEGYNYQFHHWEWRDFNADTAIAKYFNNPTSFFVSPAWEDSIHYWAAFFTGGPFGVSAVYPSSSTTSMPPDSLVTLRWLAPEGARSSCSLYVSFSSDGGAVWTPVAGPIKFNSGGTSVDGAVQWRVPHISSGNCKFKYYAYDAADNHSTSYSSTFAVSCPRPVAKFTVSLQYDGYPRYYKFRDMATNDPVSWFWDFGDGTYSTLRDPRHLYYPGTYTVRFQATNSCGSDDTTVVHCISIPPCLATLPDADGDGRGDSCDLCSSVYNPRQEDVDHDGIGDSCCCDAYTGNVNGDPTGIADAADLSALVAYLTSTGYRPPCDGEANVNSRGIIDSADLSALVSYLVGGGFVLPPCPHSWSGAGLLARDQMQLLPR